MKYTIDTEELAKLKAELDVIKLEPAAETTLARIIQISEEVEQLKELAKEQLLAKARELNPNFKSWEADTIRISMRPYGAKYYINEAEFALAPKELFTTKADVIAPNVDFKEIEQKLTDAGFTVDKTKTKGEEKLKISRSVDTKAVDKWVKEHRGLPTGVNIVLERPVSLSFNLKAKDSEADYGEQ